MLFPLKHQTQGLSIVGTRADEIRADREGCQTMKLFRITDFKVWLCFCFLSQEPPRAERESGEGIKEADWGPR